MDGTNHERMTMMMPVVDEGTLDGFVVLPDNNDYYYTWSYVTLRTYTYHIIWVKNYLVISTIII